MSFAQLNILLASGSSSIVFDSRPDEYSETKKRGPFFKHSSLKNALVIKTGEGHGGLRTRLFLPFDSANTSRGGMSMLCEPKMTCEMIEASFNAKFDHKQIEGDVRKLEILASTPSFAPFLLRDAFERASVPVDVSHFKVSESEVTELKDLLKAKLKPLAAMALPSAGTKIESAKLDVLVNKLWELNDVQFLQPFAQALKIPKDESIETLYAWIGVSYFNREFSKRQTALRNFAEWLVSKPPFPPGTRDEVIAQYELDRKPVRDRMRATWTAAGAIFDRFNSSYDKLIQDSDAGLFVEYLSRVRSDFQMLGAYLAVIEQALCIHGAIVKEPRGSQRSLDLLRELSASMRAAATEAAQAAA